jgi:uncharacterized repeat protein (TIGR01451 family)
MIPINLNPTKRKIDNGKNLAVISQLLNCLLPMNSYSLGNKYLASLAFLSTCLLSQWSHAQVSGTVFRDFNANGTRQTGSPTNEIGIEGVTVTAYNASGLPAGSTTSAADGTYTIPGVSGAVRVEFTGLQMGDYSSLAGGTSVQFVTAPISSINFAVNYPADYCQANPTVAVPTMRNGRSSGNGGYGIVTFPYTSSGTITPATSFATFAQVGSVWGQAYQATKKRSFFTAFTKRHSGFGTQGEGGVYVVDQSSGSPVLSSFSLANVAAANGGTIDVGTIDRTTNSDYTLGLSSAANIDIDAFDKVGKTSFGDAEMSEDGNTLWIANLNQTALISVDVSGATLPGTVNQYVLTGLPTCTAGQFRIFGLRAYRGYLYVGGVCTSENGGATADLWAYVLRYDPNNIAAGYTTVLSFDLDYPREGVGGGGGATRWKPWSSTWNSSFNIQNYRYPEPILSNIDFAGNGDMVLALMDRHGHQLGFLNYPAISGSTTANEEGMTMGDLLHACYQNGAWVLEGGDPACTDNDINPLPSQSSTDGPFGTGEYYYRDYYSDNGTSISHEEISTGSILIRKGSEEVLSTVFDPIAPSGLQTQGIHRYNTETGAFINAYRVVNNQSVNTFGKATGLGDIEPLCNLPPLEIGNRIWTDSTPNGVQDANETGINGIVVRLYEGTTLVGTTTTANGGQWYFNSTNVTGGLKPNTTYTIRVLSTAFPSGQVLTATNIGGMGQPDVRDSDATLVSGNAEIAYTTGYYGQNDHTLDIGFKLPCVTPAAPTISVTDNVCPAGTGSFNIVTDCGSGSHIEWSIDNGTSWTPSAPTYAANITAIARCVNDVDITCFSANSNSVTSNPTIPPSCDDNNCNTTDTYNTTTCQCDNTPIAPPSCDDNNCGTLDSYDTNTCQCVNTPIAPLNCDDNNCGTLDSYDTNTCQCVNTPIAPPSCDDNNCGTLDSYDTNTCQCVNTPIAPPSCDDNNCGTLDSYDTNTCQCVNTPIAPPSCDDNNCGTLDSYDTNTCQCVNTPIAPPSCDDNNCGTLDSYDTNTCQCVNTPIAPPSCDDNNCGTLDSYDTNTCQCVNTPIAPPSCDDNNCGTLDSYDTNTCQCVNTPIAPLNCDDNNCGTLDSYDTNTCQCVNTPIAPLNCDDNNCNTADVYNTATCQCEHNPISPTACDDNDCTTLDSYDTNTCQCVNTPTFTLNTPVLSVADNTCSPIANGSINVVNGCGAGTHIEYSTDNGTNWTSIMPTYGVSPMSLIARCVSDSDGTCSGNNSPSVTTAPQSCLPDLSLNKTVNTAIATLNSQVTFTLTLTNDNSITATGVVVTDQLPAGVTFVSTSDPANVNVSGSTITWNVGTFLGTDAPKTLNITATASNEGVFVNNVEITAMNGTDSDSTPNNDVASEDDQDQACFSVPVSLCSDNATAAVIVTADAAITYQWYVSTDNGASYTALSGGTNQVLTINNTLMGGNGITKYFKVAYNGASITDGCGNVMCCPVIVTTQTCVVCPAPKCIPIAISKVNP